MAGFVDVSNMSDLEVKRLCQADEPDMPVKRQRYVRPPATMYTTATVFAAAFAAQVANGNQYVGSGAYYFDSEGKYIPKKSNREIMVEILADESKITANDRKMGEKIRNHYKGLMFKILGGKVLNEFDTKALALANGEIIGERDLGTVAYLPQGYAKAAAKQSVQDRINDAKGGYVGHIGDKVSFAGEVLSVVYSQQWACHYVTIITDQDQAMFFSVKACTVTVGDKINGTGTVKAHHGDGKTQLNRAKLFVTL